MDNRNLSLYSIIIISLLFCACSSVKNPKERNSLVFQNSKEKVLDSICAMNKILTKIGFDHFVYAISANNELYINPKTESLDRVGLLTDSLLYKNKLLAFIEKKDRLKFLCLNQYLSKNFLLRCDFECNQFIYMYRTNIYMADRQDDLFRFIIYASSKQEINLNHYKILDHYKNLYLLAYKNAKIWADD